MKTAVVILNWNTCQYLRDLLPSLLESVTGLDAEVVVADSASTDGSLELLREDFPAVRTIPLDQNYGFTGGYNRAIQTLLSESGSPKYLLLINSDILCSKGWLEPLVQYMDGHEDCGVCGPKLHALYRSGTGEYVRSTSFEYAGAAGGLLDRYGYPFCRGRVMSRLEDDRGQYDSGPRDVFWVSGACLLTKANLWRELGGLDDRFFAHMEEIDYCWRAQLSGYRVAVVPESVAWHLGGGTLPNTSSFKLKLNYRNNLLMLQNNLPRSIGEKRARRRIAMRFLLDYMSATVYLLTGQIDKFSSVRQAHSEYRSLRCSKSVLPRVEAQNQDRGSCAKPALRGFYDISIILQAGLRGGKIFEYLRAYENSH